MLSLARGCPRVISGFSGVPIRALSHELKSALSNSIKKWLEGSAPSGHHPRRNEDPKVFTLDVYGCVCVCVCHVGCVRDVGGWCIYSSLLMGIHVRIFIFEYADLNMQI